MRPEEILWALVEAFFSTLMGDVEEAEKPVGKCEKPVGIMIMWEKFLYAFRNKLVDVYNKSEKRLAGKLAEAINDLLWWFIRDRLKIREEDSLAIRQQFIIVKMAKGGNVVALDSERRKKRVV